MISWLKGQKVDIWRLGSRQGIVIACEGVGYEVQLLPKYLLNLDKTNCLTIWVHQVQREDGYTLFGFQEKAERDLFRVLVSVSGVGPQIAIGLLEQLSVTKLVRAIIHGDLRSLSSAQGVGKRTA